MNKELLDKIAKLPPLKRERLELEIEDFFRRTSEEDEFAARDAKERQLQLKEMQAEKEREERANSENAVNAINTEVRKVASARSLDLTKTKDYDEAWKIARQTKPELFPVRK